ncbi:MAG: alpha/beta fold hydrolase [Burkholderiales bacterium]|nr:alpha/beta fold hydrolase [Burkholderiales bacterium]
MVNDTHETIVVLLSGLWTPACAMLLVQRRVERAGLRCMRFGYAATRSGLEDNSRRLASVVRALRWERVCIVGHSLGGVIALHAVATHRLTKVCRIVMMGSPYGDSFAARSLARWRLGRWMLGKTVPAWLACEKPQPPQGVEVGVITGTRAVGLGTLVAPDMPRPHDGVIRTQETRVPGMRAQVELPVSHIGMAFSRRVGDLVVRFLLQGRFESADDAPVLTAGEHYPLGTEREAR